MYNYNDISLRIQKYIFAKFEESILKFNLILIRCKRITMQRAPYSHRILKSKRKFSIKSFGSSKNNSNYHNKPTPNNKKIPLIIKQIQHGLQLLKTFYQQLNQSKIQHRSLLRKNSRPYSSLCPAKIKTRQANDEQTVTSVVPQVQQLKKSFINTYGYNSNNVVQLYNFYKKNCQKSTKLFASTSISNMVNLTHNQSDIRDKGGKGNYVINNQKKQNKQQINNQSYFVEHKLKNVANKNKQNDMIKVSNLLEQKKKITRKNIMQNMNEQNLFNQTKKKLYKITSNDNNINKLIKIKSNLKCQSDHIMPNNKFKDHKDHKDNNNNNNNIKQKSSSKKDHHAKMHNKQIKHEQFCKINEFDQKVKQSKIQQIAKQQQLQEGAQSRNSKPQNQLSQTKKQISSLELKTDPNQSNPSTCKAHQKPQQKQLTELKSARSLKLTYSQSSKKSALLNQGVLISLTGSSCKKQQCQKPMYFMPRVHNSTHDSLFQCSITPKEQSKMFDLQSIPFDF